MLVRNPVEGEIKPDKKNYPTHRDAVERTAGSTIPLLVHDFGPSTVIAEPPLTWPGGETNLFGTRIVAKHYDHFHKGIDISTGPCGPNVFAVAKGKVRVSGPDSSNAVVVVIDHGMIDGHHFETRYAHLQKEPKPLAVGKEVVAGTVIGKLGDTGKHSTACHLHFAITKDGKPVDPWRRLSQHATPDPDLQEVTDVPIPASNKEYLAGSIAVVGNAQLDAIVRTGPKKDAPHVRRIEAGTEERWVPTCWVKGDKTLESNRWLAQWKNLQWEFTHFNNVRSVVSLLPEP